MASSAARASLCLALVVCLLLVASYCGLPLYWKLSATIYEIQRKRLTAEEGISQMLWQIQWLDDESDPGSKGAATPLVK